MKFILAFLFIALFSAQSKYTDFEVGHIDAIFYNFKNFTMVNLMPLKNSSGDNEPENKYDSRVEKFTYNIGSYVNTCPIKTIVCIKFKNDTNYYALSVSGSWAISETGNNVSFDDNITVSFIPKNSGKPIGPEKMVGSIRFVFFCDSYPFIPHSYLYVEDNTYNYALIIFDQYACQKNFSQLLLYLSSISNVLGGIAIFIGIFMNFFGLKHFKKTLFIIGAIIGFFIALIICTQFLHTEEAYVAWQYVVICLGCIIFAIALGFIFAIVYKVGIVALCACFGIIIWAMIYDSCLANQPLFALYCGGIVFACVLGLISTLFLRHIVTISTSFIGSYLFIRGISVYAGGFPNVLLIYDIIKSGGTFDNVFYIYLGAIIILTIVGVIVQEITNSEKYKKSLWNPTDGRDLNYVGLTDR